MNLSVIIPCKNEEKYIEKCVKSVLAAIEGVDSELIVVDGVSTDGTVDILRSIKSEKLKLLKNDKCITPIGMNIGIKAAKGQFIAILGAHSEVGTKYFVNGLAILIENNTIGCVGGILDNVFEDKISGYIGKAMTSGFGVGNAHFRTGLRSGEVDTVAFGIYPKKVFDKIGLFDESLPRNQDDELNYRVKKAGYKIFLSADMTAKYYVRGNFKKLYRQYYQYGYWKVKVNLKHGAITTLRQLVPPIFVVGNFVGIGLSFVDRIFFIVYLTAIVLYLIGGAYYAARCSKIVREWVNILYSFMILHFAYGLGYLEGILKFMVLQRQNNSRRQEITR